MQKMPNHRLVATQLEDGTERIELYEDLPGGLFRKATSRLIPRQDWPKFAPQSALSAFAVARSVAWLSEIPEDATSVFLPPNVVAGLDESDAHALGLPPVTPLTLQLRSSGSLFEGTIAVESKWVRRGGVPARETSWRTCT